MLDQELLRVLDRVTLRELIGLAESSPSSPISTALEEVEPPSRPITARTVWPGVKAAGTNFGIL